MIELRHDTKQELLRKYLKWDGKFLYHVWSGCFAIKKNKDSINFISRWLEMTELLENRSQFTKYPNYKNFYWHSPEQGTLSVSYYLSVNDPKIFNQIKLINLNNSRIIPPNHLYKDKNFIFKYLKVKVKSIISLLIVFYIFKIRNLKIY